MKTSTREIKFRIWNGSQMEYRIMAGYLGTFYVQGIDEKDSACMSPFNTKLLTPPSPMQFTGFKDIKGKELYESDIIEYTTCGVRVRACIIWNEYAGAWQYQYKGALGGTPSDFMHSMIHNTRFPPLLEVIGNIYEN